MTQTPKTTVSTTRGRRRKPTRVLGDVGAGRIVAAFASVGAAAVHVAAFPDHFTEWWPAGLFFAGLGTFQAFWGLLVLRTAARVPMVLGLATNAGSIGVWAVSRTIGMPFGPTAGVPEHIGRAGTTVVVLEVMVCLVALWHLRSRDARGFASSFRAVVVVGAAGALASGAVLPAVGAALSHSHGATSQTETHSHGHGDENSSGDRKRERDARPPDESTSSPAIPTEGVTESPDARGDHAHSGEGHGH